MFGVPRTRAEPGRRGSRGTLPLNRSARIGPGPARNCVLSTGGRARRRLRVVLGGHHLHSGADVVRHPNERSPDRTRLAVDEEPERFRAGHATAHEERSADRRSDRSRRCPRERSSRPGRSSTRSGERLARLAIDRASREARLAASMWVGKVRLSPRTAMDPGAGAGWVAADCRGSPCRRAPPCPTWAMAAAGPWGTTPFPARPPTQTLAPGGPL